MNTTIAVKTTDIDVVPPQFQYTREDVLDHLALENGLQASIDALTPKIEIVAEAREKMILSFGSEIENLCLHLTASFAAYPWATDQRKQHVSKRILSHFNRLWKDNAVSMKAEKYQFTIAEVTADKADWEKALDTLAPHFTPIENASMKATILDSMATKAERLLTDSAYAKACQIRKQEQDARQWLLNVAKAEHITAKGMEIARMAINC